MELNALFMIMFMLVLFFFIFAYDHHRREKAASILNQWAFRHNYTLMNTECRRFLMGPFFFRSSNAQIVYRVQLYDPQAQTYRRGWVRIGSYWFGLLDPKINILWD